MNNGIEVVGLCATLFVLISLCQSDGRRLRWLNTCGSIIFVVYGVLIGALSVWLLNGICAVVNLYKLHIGTDKNIF